MGHDTVALRGSPFMRRRRCRRLPPDYRHRGPLGQLPPRVLAQRQRRPRPRWATEADARITENQDLGLSRARVEIRHFYW